MIARTFVVLAAAALLVLALPTPHALHAAQQDGARPPQPAPSDGERPAWPPNAAATPPAADAARPTTAEAMEGLGATLLKALRESPGCLGVDSGTMESGKEAIFAWFENKKAVLTWYHSPTHQGLAGAMFGGRRGHEPLAKIAEDSGPLLVIASLTPSDRPRLRGVPMPISQIAIEVYQPMPAGLSINGAFTPAKVPVPGRRDAGGAREGAAGRKEDR